MIEVSDIYKQESSTITFKEPSLYEAILKQVQQMHGDFGVAAIRAGFTAKYCNEHTKIAVIRVRRGPHKIVASVLPCIKTLDKKNVTVRTLYCGATIRQCFYFIKNYQQEKFDQYCKTLKTDEEKIALKESMKHFENVLINL